MPLQLENLLVVMWTLESNITVLLFSPRSRVMSMILERTLLVSYLDAITSKLSIWVSCATVKLSSILALEKKLISSVSLVSLLLLLTRWFSMLSSSRKLDLRFHCLLVELPLQKCTLLLRSSHIIRELQLYMSWMPLDQWLLSKSF
jgi:hypothetical protein